jgi:hypothetical protein
MKTLLFLILLQIETSYSPNRKLTITIKFLPEFVQEFKGKIMSLHMEIERTIIDTSFMISENLTLTFENFKSNDVYIRAYGTVLISDSDKRKYWLHDLLKYNPNRHKFSEIEFPVNCETNKYYGGKICKKCRKTDEVIPIMSGLLSPDISGELGVDYYLGGCIRTPCDPSWFCKRDTLEF